ncbi:MAG TPA: hypothetical protein VNW90_24275 [Acetobacteraceae bacterium]|jgi:hypothetical protein|nr:hypothetical protein [Acetobacteraceae bacterium]
MKSTTPKPQSPEFRALQNALAKANNEQVSQVVTAIDVMGLRGIVDEIIAPLRPRLALLRPGRPLRWTRLMFLPLDPLIVPTAQWRLGQPMIPRSCLTLLASAVRAGMGSDADAITREIKNLTTADAATSGQIGSLLWPVAARILADAALPEGWAETSLPTEAFAPLARDVAAALEQVMPMDAIRADAAFGVMLQFATLRPILVAAASHGPTALAMVVVLLLARLPQTGPLLDCSALTGVTAGEAPLRDAIVRARAVLLARIEGSGGVEALVVGSSLADAAAEVRQIDALLCGLRNSDNKSEAARREAAICQRLDASCRTRFAAGLASEFIGKLQGPGARQGSAVLAALEATARNLRELESEARRIGSPELYDTLLRETAATVTTLEPGGPLSLVDKVRLVEILVGPDEALAVLEGRA